jgi:hypothetical protein
MLTQTQVKTLLTNGVLNTSQVEKCVDLGLVSRRYLVQRKRMIMTSDGRYTEPRLTFVGNGQKTSYSETMVKFKEDFETLVEMYTEEIEVQKYQKGRSQ